MAEKKQTVNMNRIPPEKMARLAKKGPHGVRLTQSEYHYLLHKGGLEELREIRDIMHEPDTPLEQELVEKIVQTIPEHGRWVPDIRIRLREGMRAMVRALSDDCEPGSTAFAFRGKIPKETDVVHIHRRAGNRTVHLQIHCAAPELMDVAVVVVDSHDKPISSLSVSLFQNARCLDSITSSHDEHLTLRRIRPGDYTLRIADTKNEITMFNLRLE